MLATLPGLWVTQGRWSYGAPEQLAQGLTVLAWAWLAWALAQAGQGQKILAALFYIGGFCAVAALLETAMLGHLTPSLFRAKASFGNAGYLAGWLLLVLPLGFARILPFPFAKKGQNNAYSPKTGKGMRFALGLQWAVDSVLTVAVFAALLAGKTRVAQLLTLLFTGGLISLGSIRLFNHLPVSKSGTGRWPAVVALLSALALGTFLLAQADIWTRFQALSNGSDWQGRLVPWRAALAAFQEAPWLGHGPGSFYSVFFQYVDEESRAFWIQRSYFDPHNLLLDMAVEGGWLGLSIGIFCWGGWLWMLLQVARDQQLSAQQRHQVTAVMGGVVLMLAFSLTAVSYRMMTLMLPAQVLLATTLGLRPRPAANQQVDAPPSRMIWWCWPVLIVLAWWLGNATLNSKYRFMTIETTLPPPARYAPLAQLCDDNPNIYALERLLQEALIRADWSRFFKTAKQIERQIPHFRNTRHVIAQGYMRRGDYRNARKAALDFQQRDRYYADNNKLLLRLAVLQHDPVLLRTQFELALNFALRKQQVMASRVKKAILIDASIETSAFAISSPDATEDTLTVSIPLATQKLVADQLLLWYRGQTSDRQGTGNIIRYVLAPLAHSLPAEVDYMAFSGDLLSQLL